MLDLRFPCDVVLKLGLPFDREGGVDVADRRLFSHQASERPDLLDAKDAIGIRIHALNSIEEILENASGRGKGSARTQLACGDRHSSVGDLEAVSVGRDEPTVEAFFEHDGPVTAFGKNFEIDHVSGFSVRMNPRMPFLKTAGL